MADRIRQFKNFGKDSEELRRRRTDVTVELRKSRKDQQLTKRRNIDLDEPDYGSPAKSMLNEDSAVVDVISGVDGSGDGGGVNADKPDNGRIPTNLIESTNAQISYITLAKITGDMFSGNARQEFIGCQMARKILSRERHPPIDPIISSGIVPKCIEFLSSPNMDTQFEAAWIITNIASGNGMQTSYLIEQRAVDPLIALLKSPHTHIVEQAIWALGNIAGDGPKLRDYLISKGIIPPLIGLLKVQSVPSFVRNIAWTLSNLCRSKQPSPPVEATRQIIPALLKVIMMDDAAAISDACWALSYLSDGPNEKIEEVVRSGVLPRVIQLLNSSEYSVVTPCLRIIGNIVTGNDSQTDRVIESGPIIPILGRLLQSAKPNIVKEAAWTISNITAGTVSQVNEVINGNIIPPLLHVVQHGDFRAQKEAVWCITNITSGGSMEHMVYLCQNGAIPALCAMLKCKDPKAIMVAIDGMENILKGAAEVGELQKIQFAVEECGGLESLEAIQNHENVAVYTRAYNLVEKYFSDENDDDQHLLPTHDNEQFQLNVQKPPKNGFNL